MLLLNVTELLSSSIPNQLGAASLKEPGAKGEFELRLVLGLSILHKTVQPARDLWLLLIQSQEGAKMTHLEPAMIPGNGR